jgi:deoxyribodipyrimidine photolyase-related protein
MGGYGAFMKTCVLILGNQLFDPSFLKGEEEAEVFLREDMELCTHFKYHQLKIALFLNAMRSYADELKEAGFSVHYEKLSPSKIPYEEHFEKFLKGKKITRVVLFEIEDKFFEERIMAALKRAKVEVQVLASPMFVTSRDDFQAYLKKYKKPFMKLFYEQQRKKFKVLLTQTGKPVGGKWSFDTMNRKPLPAKVNPPAPKDPVSGPHANHVAALCKKHFSDHPGDASALWFATDREGAKDWLKEFLTKRFAEFGPYEDALTDRSDFVFHSAITPYLNIGLLTPKEVLATALAVAKRKEINIESVEGFVRQVLGWREFIRGIYQNFSEYQEKQNFFGHKRKLSKAWYEGKTGIPPLDETIAKVDRLGYAHHIERLMVLGNLMLLCEVHPEEAHRWFMEMFVDSSDWVMGPNVYGMALFSDGGVFATKPYICGSNYYRKMGGYKQGDWCDGVDGLYWGFIDKNREFFGTNPRLSMMVRILDKMAEEKKDRIFAAAEELKAKLTRPA